MNVPSGRKARFSVKELQYSGQTPLLLEYVRTMSQRAPGVAPPRRNRVCPSRVSRLPSIVAGLPSMVRALVAGSNV